MSSEIIEELAQQFKLGYRECLTEDLCGEVLVVVQPIIGFNDAAQLRVVVPSDRVVTTSFFTGPKLPDMINFISILDCVMSNSGHFTSIEVKTCDVIERDTFVHFLNLIFNKLTDNDFNQRLHRWLYMENPNE